jgi:hypothetical protein
MKSRAQLPNFIANNAALIFRTPSGNRLTGVGHGD